MLAAELPPLLVALLLLVGDADGYGKMVDPPQRSSLWREPQFYRDRRVHKNYNDHALNCGGLQKQNALGGKCGICGDAWDTPKPRPNEAGGRYARGIIGRTYSTVERFIPITVQVMSSMAGYFEFHICPNNNIRQQVSLECLLRHPMRIYSANQMRRLGQRYYPAIPPGRTGLVQLSLEIPPGLVCSQCVLRWKWRGAINFGPCQKGYMGRGCGNQTEIYNCADIAIRPEYPRGVGVRPFSLRARPSAVNSISPAPSATTSRSRSSPKDGFRDAGLVRTATPLSRIVPFQTSHPLPRHGQVKKKRKRLPKGIMHKKPKYYWKRVNRIPPTWKRNMGNNLFNARTRNRMFPKFTNVRPSFDMHRERALHFPNYMPPSGIPHFMPPFDIMHEGTTPMAPFGMFPNDFIRSGGLPDVHRDAPMMSSAWDGSLSPSLEGGIVANDKTRHVDVNTIPIQPAVLTTDVKNNEEDGEIIGIDVGRIPTAVGQPENPTADIAADLRELRMEVAVNDFNNGLNGTRLIDPSLISGVNVQPNTAISGIPRDTLNRDLTLLKANLNTMNVDGVGINSIVDITPPGTVTKLQDTNVIPIDGVDMHPVVGVSPSLGTITKLLDTNVIPEDKVGIDTVVDITPSDTNLFDPTIIPLARVGINHIVDVPPPGTITQLLDTNVIPEDRVGIHHVVDVAPPGTVTKLFDSNIIPVDRVGINSVGDTTPSITDSNLFDPSIIPVDRVGINSVGDITPSITDPNLFDPSIIPVDRVGINHVADMTPPALIELHDTNILPVNRADINHVHDIAPPGTVTQVQDTNIIPVDRVGINSVVDIAPPGTVTKLIDTHAIPVDGLDMNHVVNVASPGIVTHLHDTHVIPEDRVDIHHVVDIAPSGVVTELQDTNLIPPVDIASNRWDSVTPSVDPIPSPGIGVTVGSVRIATDAHVAHTNHAAAVPSLNIPSSGPVAIPSHASTITDDLTIALPIVPAINSVQPPQTEAMVSDILAAPRISNGALLTATISPISVDVNSLDTLQQLPPVDTTLLMETATISPDVSVVDVNPLDTLPQLPSSGTRMLMETATIPPEVPPVTVDGMPLAELRQIPPVVDSTIVPPPRIQMETFRSDSSIIPTALDDRLSITDAALSAATISPIDVNPLDTLPQLPPSGTRMFMETATIPPDVSSIVVDVNALDTLPQIRRAVDSAIVPPAVVPLETSQPATSITRISSDSVRQISNRALSTATISPISVDINPLDTLPQIPSSGTRMLMETATIPPEVPPIAVDVIPLDESRQIPPVVDSTIVPPPRIQIETFRSDSSITPTALDDRLSITDAALSTATISPIAIDVNPLDTLRQIPLTGTATLMETATRPPDVSPIAVNANPLESIRQVRPVGTEMPMETATVPPDVSVVDVNPLDTLSQIRPAVDSAIVPPDVVLFETSQTDPGITRILSDSRPSLSIGGSSTATIYPIAIDINPLDTLPQMPSRGTRMFMETATIPPDVPPVAINVNPLVSIRQVTPFGTAMLMETATLPPDPPVATILPSDHSRSIVSSVSVTLPNEVNTRRSEISSERIDLRELPWGSRGIPTVDSVQSANSADIRSPDIVRPEAGIDNIITEEVRTQILDTSPTEPSFDNVLLDNANRLPGFESLETIVRTMPLDVENNRVHIIEPLGDSALNVRIRADIHSADSSRTPSDIAVDSATIPPAVAVGVEPVDAVNIHTRTDTNSAETFRTPGGTNEIIVDSAIVPAVILPLDASESDTSITRIATRSHTLSDDVVPVETAAITPISELTPFDSIGRVPSAVIVTNDEPFIPTLPVSDITAEIALDTVTIPNQVNIVRTETSRETNGVRTDDARPTEITRRESDVRKAVTATNTNSIHVDFPAKETETFGISNVIPTLSPDIDILHTDTITAPVDRHTVPIDVTGVRDIPNTLTVDPVMEDHILDHMIVEPAVMSSGMIPVDTARTNTSITRTVSERHSLSPSGLSLEASAGFPVGDIILTDSAPSTWPAGITLQMETATISADVPVPPVINSAGVSSPAAVDILTHPNEINVVHTDASSNTIDTNAVPVVSGVLLNEGLRRGAVDAARSVHNVDVRSRDIVRPEISFDDFISSEVRRISSNNEPTLITATDGNIVPVNITVRETDTFVVNPTGPTPPLVEGIIHVETSGTHIDGSNSPVETAGIHDRHDFIRTNALRRDVAINDMTVDSEVAAPALMPFETSRVETSMTQITPARQPLNTIGGSVGTMSDSSVVDVTPIHSMGMPLSADGTLLLESATVSPDAVMIPTAVTPILPTGDVPGPATLAILTNPNEANVVIAETSRETIGTNGIPQKSGVLINDGNRRVPVDNARSVHTVDVRSRDIVRPVTGVNSVISSEISNIRSNHIPTLLTATDRINVPVDIAASESETVVVDHPGPTVPPVERIIHIGTSTSHTDGISALIKAEVVKAIEDLMRGESGRRFNTIDDIAVNSGVVPSTVVPAETSRSENSITRIAAESQPSVIGRSIGTITDSSVVEMSPLDSWGIPPSADSTLHIETATVSADAVINPIAVTPILPVGGVPNPVDIDRITNPNEINVVITDTSSGTIGTNRIPQDSGILVNGDTHVTVGATRLVNNIDIRSPGIVIPETNVNDISSNTMRVASANLPMVAASDSSSIPAGITVRETETIVVNPVESTTLPVEGMIDIGTPARQIDGVTAPGDATVIDIGTSARQIDDVTAPGEATVIDIGTPARQIDGVTAPGEATVIDIGTSTRHIDGVTAPGDATVIDIGASARHIDGVTAPGEAAVIDIGTPTRQIDGVTAPNEATVIDIGTSTRQIDGVTAPGEATVIDIGTSVRQIDGITAPDEATVIDIGTSARHIDGVTAPGEATVIDIGTSARQIDDVTAPGEAMVIDIGTSARHIDGVTEPGEAMVVQAGADAMGADSVRNVGAITDMIVDSAVSPLAAMPFETSISDTGIARMGSERRIPIMHGGSVGTISDSSVVNVTPLNSLVSPASVDSTLLLETTTVSADAPTLPLETSISDAGIARIGSERQIPIIHGGSVGTVTDSSVIDVAPLNSLVSPASVDSTLLLETATVSADVPTLPFETSISDAGIARTASERRPSLVNAGSVGTITGLSDIAVDSAVVQPAVVPFETSRTETIITRITPEIQPSDINNIPIGTVTGLSDIAVDSAVVQPAVVPLETTSRTETIITRITPEIQLSDINSGPIGTVTGLSDIAVDSAIVQPAVVPLETSRTETIITRITPEIQPSDINSGSIEMTANPPVVDVTSLELLDPPSSAGTIILESATASPDLPITPILPPRTDVARPSEIRRTEADVRRVVTATDTNSIPVEIANRESETFGISNVIPTISPDVDMLHAETITGPVGGNTVPSSDISSLVVAESVTKPM